MLYNFLNTTKNTHLFILYIIGVFQIFFYRFVIFELPFDGITLAGTILMCFLLLVNISTISLIHRENQLNEGNLFVIFFWVFLISFFPEIYKESTQFVANTIVLFIFYKILQLHNTIEPRFIFLDTSLLALIAGLFFLPACLILLLLWVYILIYSHRRSQNFFIPIVAFIIVVIIVSAIGILIGEETLFLSYFQYYPDFSPSSFLQYKYIPILGVLLINIFLTFWIIGKFYKHYLSRFFSLIVLTGVLGLLCNEKSAVAMIYLTLPAALSLMIIVTRIRRFWIREFFLGIFIIASILFSFLGVFFRELIFPQ